MKKFPMQSYFFPLFLISPLNANSQVLEGNVMVEDISQQVANEEKPVINIDLNIGYQSNIDLLDRNLYEVKYTDNSVMNINANASLKKRLLGNQLIYDTSLNSQFVYSDEYDKSSDFVRRSTFKNNFFLNLIEGNGTFDFGPTLSLNAEKRYTRPGWYRKRDNVAGLVGLKAKIAPTSKLTITPESSVGHLDHKGTYVPPDPARFTYEREFEEDRTVIKNSLTTSYIFNKHLTLTIPLSLNRDIYKERRARFASENIEAYHAMSLAQWTTETGLPFQDPTMDVQTFSSGLKANINLNDFNSLEIGYKYIDEREKNEGHRYSDTDNDVINFSMTISPTEKIKLSLGYENYDTRYYRLWGGGKEITQTYSSTLTLTNLINSKITAVLDFSYTDYQFSLPSISWQERASNSMASIGISASI